MINFLKISMDVDKLMEKSYELYLKKLENFDENLIFIHFVEEVGEIAREITSKNLLKKRKFDEENLKMEISQALIDLFVLAKLCGIDNLSRTIARKIDEIEKK